jgi:hypothetical protein
MLLSIRNTFRRAQSPAERGPRIDVPKPGYPREIRKHRAPVRSCGLWVCPRQLVKAASVPLELDPPSSRIFRCRATNEPEMRLADVCNPHVKDENPFQFRVASGFVIEGALDLTGGRCQAHGDRPLRPLLRRPREGFLPAGACHGARSSDVPVTDRVSQSPKASSTRFGRDRFHRHPV